MPVYMGSHFYRFWDMLSNIQVPFLNLEKSLFIFEKLQQEQTYMLTLDKFTYSIVFYYQQRVSRKKVRKCFYFLEEIG